MVQRDRRGKEGETRGGFCGIFYRHERRSVKIFQNHFTTHLTVNSQ